MVMVEPVAGGVRVKALMEVAVATPRVGVVRFGEIERTAAEPVPTTAEIALPLMEKVLPAPAVSKVLLVRVSVVALPIN
jgi:hypothetical protein